MSADLENEYFCDGLAEELLNALAKIDDLKVAARTSAFSFKGKNTNISEIGKALTVKTVLEGSVRKAGDRVRITVQLINAADGYQPARAGESIESSTPAEMLGWGPWPGA